MVASASIHRSSSGSSCLSCRRASRAAVKSWTSYAATSDRWSVSTDAADSARAGAIVGTTEDATDAPLMRKARRDEETSGSGVDGWDIARVLTACR